VWVNRLPKGPAAIVLKDLGGTTFHRQPMYIRRAEMIGDR
jgi:hypothetical protein